MGRVVRVLEGRVRKDVYIPEPGERKVIDPVTFESPLDDDGPDCE